MDMIQINDSREWCKTYGYYVDLQLWQETYDFRLVLTPTEPENEMEFSPSGLTKICALLGKAARDILDAGAQHHNLTT